MGRKWYIGGWGFREEVGQGLGGDFPS